MSKINIVMALACIILVMIGFGVGYRQGMTKMAETGFEILEHIKINEVNLDINETELMNTMIDRFEEDYGVNIT